MSDKENRSIAYIYNEMDPSEKLEFERELNCDSNLLIEVESLKKIAGNLDELDTFEPPEEVVQAIYQKMSEQKAVKRSGSDKFIWYSAAAALLLFITAGLIIMDNGDVTTGEATDTGTAVVGGNPYIFPATSEQPAVEKADEKITPWIDHNEVIRFQDGVFSGGEAAAIDSIYRQSFQKLTPVTNPSQSVTARQNLHLTGNR